MFLKNEIKGTPSEGSVGISAVLTRKHYKLLVTGLATLEVPEGVAMTNKSGSKILQFDCEDRATAEILCDGLDVSGIAWDEMA
jgi:hypothetical protein